MGKLKWVLVLVLGSLALMPAASGSDAFYVVDRDAPDGRLAIRRLDVHQDNGTVAIVHLKHPVRPSRLSRKDFFVVDLQTNETPRPEESVFFFVRRGRWTSAFYAWDTKRWSYFSGHEIRQRSRRSIRLKFSPARFTPSGYLYRLTSFSGGRCAVKCRDSVPNGTWFVLDWSAPVVRRFEVAPFADTSPEGRPQIALTWRVTDRGLSGLTNQTLWTRYVGELEWQEVVSSGSEELMERTVDVEQGRQVQFKVSAADNYGNTVESEVVWSLAPFDDTWPEGTSYFGAWSEEERPGSYLGSLHVSASPLDTFTFSSSERVCIFYAASPEFGVAEVMANDVSIGRIDMGDTESQSPWCSPLYEAAHTLKVSVVSGVINIDGFWSQ